MKRLLLCGLVATMAACAVAEQSPPLKADPRVEGEQQILKVERDWNEALKARDKKFLDQICSEDFIFTDEEGRVSKRSKYLDDSLHHIQVASYTLSDLIAHTYGETAIVSGRWKAELSVDGQDASGIYQFTDTFVRREGHWWAIATHTSRVPSPQP